MNLPAAEEPRLQVERVEEMFGFLRSSKKAAAPAPPAQAVPAPRSKQVRQIGIDWGVETVFAVLLDEEGSPLDARTIPAPAEENAFEGLDGLLADWPLAESRLVVSLTRDYHITSLELENPSAATVAEKIAAQLPYGSDEAVFAWQPLQGNRVIAIAYPSILLDELSTRFAELKAHSVCFEAIELAQLRLLETFGLPAGLITVYADLLQLTFASPTDFETLTQSTALLGIEQMLGVGLDRWKSRGQQPPLKLFTNLSPDHLTRLSGLDSQRFEEEAVAFHLASSPEGPHRFVATTPAKA
jgi:hypothetical protein